ncbi:unnamed protein product [Ostreobium quekettii]|uniref:Uncharacterized protein n=1 Tax=Ostreobium quekettii TaxID=121088 RepID=A0A8S1J653_9CHLO|nr:unnamed protein product [Ostreobium quekettii]
MEQDFEADDPALEIPMVFSERLPRRLLERRLDAGQRHGPQRARDNPIRCAAPSPTTRGAVLGLELGDVLHWPLSAAKARRVRRLGGHAGVVAAALVPGADSAAWAGLVLTGSADACIKVWDLGAVGEGSCVQTLHGHGGTVTTLAAVGTCVVSGSTDRSVRVWRAAPGRKSLIYPWFEPEAGKLPGMERGGASQQRVRQSCTGIPETA